MKFSTKALKHWKSTASNLLTLALVTCSALLAVPDVMTKKHTSYLMAVIGVAKAWIGLIQQDAGVTEATVPGQPGPVVVPSHEIPNDPAAKPVTGENA